ncbi:hypothetical protein [Streptomyces sp. NPDC093589]|uniref:hypothetical protein n=1 Tax=Streptomyces sp. NPDC093589 TaxID=3366043 RepID=UPI003815D245
MTTRTTTEKPQAFAPGTYVYDVCADAVGRVADPEAYPENDLGRAVALVVPLGGQGTAWQAESGCLRLASADEVRSAR